MQRMMSVGVAEPVADEFVPLLLEQMGFEKPIPRRELRGRPLPPGDFRVLVIGAGPTRMLAGIKAAEAGYTYRIIEQNPDVCGTWCENRYPGVAVDTPSHFYSHSFELNPDWSYSHPRGAEMQEYLLRITGKYDLRPNITFDTRVLACEFDESARHWRVTVEPRGGEPYVLIANAVMLAHGVLNCPALFELPGLESFRGVVMHSARWRDDVVLDGKRVVLTGTGASGAQVGPEIAGRVAHLTLFQRSRHWIMNNPEVAARVSDGMEFPDSERFDADRDSPRILSFGHAAHMCLGVHVARLEGRVFLEELLGRLPDYALEDSRAVWRRADQIQGLVSLPIHLRESTA
jgi:4-hydroxyacetophenone monooxygenase